MCIRDRDQPRGQPAGDPEHLDDGRRIARLAAGRERDRDPFGRFTRQPGTAFRRQPAAARDEARQCVGNPGRDRLPQAARQIDALEQRLAQRAAVAMALDHPFQREVGNFGGAVARERDERLLAADFGQRRTCLLYTSRCV